MVVGTWSSAGAQIGAGAIAGVVVDQAGAAVPGATVTLTASGPNTTRSFVTGPDGAYAGLTLAPGAYRIRVELEGFRPLIGRAVADLPLNGRSFITLAGLAPGVALPPGSSLPRINGGRSRTNEYLFDGISVVQPEPGQVAFFPNVDGMST
jgi:hypothetical protein